MSESYKIRLEMSKGDRRLVSNLEVTDVVVEEMHAMGINAVSDAASHMLNLMVNTMREEEDVTGKEG